MKQEIIFLFYVAQMKRVETEIINNLKKNNLITLSDKNIYDEIIHMFCKYVCVIPVT